MRSIGRSLLKKKTIFVIGSLALFIVTGAFAIESLFSAVMDRLNPPSVEEGTPSRVSFVKEYPFDTASERKPEEDPAEDEPVSLVSSLTASITDVTNSVDRHISQASRTTPFYQYVFGFGQKAIGRTYVEDEEANVFRLPNGKLVTLGKRVIDEEENRSVTDFAAWLKERDTDFLMIIPLHISDDESIQFPRGMETGYGKYHQALIDQLSECHVDFFDTKPYLLSIDEDFFHWVYRNDHHWNVRAGFLTTKRTLQIMRDSYGYDVDPAVCDMAQYDSVVYPSVFLGSLGKKVTDGYISREDFEILYPKFDTSFHIEIQPSYDKIGSFDETLIRQSAIDADGNAYGAFMRGDHGLIRIHNEKCSNGIRVLMLKQSKANVITPYLACAVEYLDIIDPRHFDGSIRTFVTKTNPDMVMICSAEPIPTD